MKGNNISFCPRFQASAAN